MNKPLLGSEAKEWTEVSTPDLTINVPKREREKPKIESRIDHEYNFFLKSVTIIEWINAVAISQGIKATFSTGSQNHQPPHPNS